MKHFAFITSVLFLTAVRLFSASGNAITVTDLSGAVQTNRPITISRVFAQGDIAGFAQARVNGTPVTTQCDVKTRWPDGSLQHALVSFNATIGSRATVTVDFISQTTGNNTGYLNKAGMLAFNESASGTGNGWGATIEAAVSGLTKSANARTMLNNLNVSTDFNTAQVRYWMAGPVVTQVIIEDKSPNRSADFGWSCTGGCTGDYASATWATDNQNRSLHPIFVVTFYPANKTVKVDYILENMWTTALQDQRYTVNLKSGANLASRYSKAVTHYAATRWRKTFWSGTAPGDIKIDHNLPYLISTKALPNYDPSVPVSTSKVASDISAFNATDRGDINGNGQYQKYMPGTGQTTAAHIGILPEWQVRYLYTMSKVSDNAMLDGPVLGNAAVSGHVPIHLRESLTGRSFRDANNDGLADTDDAFGRMISIDARPRVRLGEKDDDPADRIVAAGTRSDAHGWSPEQAHQPAFTYLPYLITGDWYFLEELYAWAAYNLGIANPGTTLGWSRHETWGFMNQGAIQTRGQAWALRTIGQAAFVAPDGTPEKAQFVQKVNNNIAVQEGIYNITGSPLYSACTTNPYNAATEKSKWCWGNKTASQGPDFTGSINYPNLGFISYGEPNCHDYVVSNPQANYCVLTWQEHMLYAVWGHLNELGFNYSKILQDRSKYYTSRILDPSYSPYLIQAYQTPVMTSDSKFLTSWSSVKSAFLPAVRDARTWEATGASDYAYIGFAAVSYAYPYSNGSHTGKAAWEWLKANLYNVSGEENPKWAFLPRGTGGSSTPPPVTPPPPDPVVSSCDINKDNFVNALDVQMGIDQALGTSSCTGDLDSNGRCDVIDVQRVINAALGGACRTGS